VNFFNICAFSSSVSKTVLAALFRQSGMMDVDCMRERRRGQLGWHGKVDLHSCHKR
jgi:hypothetical protein